MKRVFHRLGRHFGLKVYRLSTIERGILVWVDVGRLIGQKKKPLIFDVGANMGQTALNVLNFLPGAEIRCFEPVSSTYSTLKARTKNIPNIQAINCALSNSEGDGWITNQPNSGQNRLLSGAAAGKKS